MSFVHFEQLRFRYFQAVVYCKTINAFCSSLSTYHLVFEPYFHFPLGSLKLNQTPVASGAQWTASSLYSIWQTPKAKQSQIPLLSNSSYFILRSVLYGWWLWSSRNLILLLKLSVMWPAVVFLSLSLSLSGGREEKKTSRRHLTWSAPPPPNLCPLSQPLSSALQ